MSWRLKTIFLCLSTILLFLAAGAARSGGENIPWLNYEQALDKQARQARPLLIFFHLTYCYRCKNMKQWVYSDPEVIRRLKRDFWPVMVDLSREKDLARRYGIDYVPTHIWQDARGKRILRVKDAIAKKRFLLMLSYVSEGAYKRQRFNDYARGR